MRRFALLLGVALSLLTTSAIAQNCDGFTDVLASSPFCPDVTWIAQYGVTKGCAPSHFCPNENVTRLQMAAFMHRLGNNPAFVNGGNMFGTTAVLGTADFEPLNFLVNNQPVMRYEPTSGSPNIIGGHSNNSADTFPGETIAGGGMGGTNCYDPPTDTNTRSCGNQVLQGFATAGGGYANIASGVAATVGGGTSNTAGNVSFQSFGATVGGGMNNTASGDFATIGGGVGNTASGIGATVAGGSTNTASGTGSFAAGHRANADQDQCFVFANWSSQPGSNLSCGYKNIAIFGLDHGLSVSYGTAQGNGNGTNYVYFGDLNVGNTIAVWNGAVLTDGGAWTNASDRALKSDFTAVDAQAVLAKVVLLPIDEWSYKSEDGHRHLGPVAQDFYAAFGLGADDKHITTVDEGGVALAAIKGLYERLQVRDREIAALREELNAIKAALNLR
jgi:trimeric autotransporter adhesin